MRNWGELRSGRGNQEVDLDPFMDHRKPVDVQFRPTASGAGASATQPVHLRWWCGVEWDGCGADITYVVRPLEGVRVPTGQQLAKHCHPRPSDTLR